MNQNLYRCGRNLVFGLLAISGSGLWAQNTEPARQKAPSKVVLVLGDSLSAEYGLVRGTGWVALLEKRLVAEKISATILNASVSGETTSGGRSRLPALLLQHQPSVVVIELGANDALRGLALQNTEENLAQMTQAAQNSGAKVLLLGMQVPPNYGSDYARKFAGIFEWVAQKSKAGVVPFFLKGIADSEGDGARALFQADQIHPRAQAHPKMLENVWPALRKLLH